MTRIAIMQPYFLPYAGYFRLMVGVDAFVVADGLQYMRYGWVNRNRLRDDLGRLMWLTLPLARHGQHAIGSINFSSNAAATWPAQMRRFRACRSPNEQTAGLVARMRELAPTPAELITDLLLRTSTLLGIEAPVVKMSDLELEPGLRKAEVIYAICEKLGAREYVNAPGGRELYDGAQFSARGLRLLFLPPYKGDYASILQRLSDEPAETVRQEILANAPPEPE